MTFSPLEKEMFFQMIEEFQQELSCRSCNDFPVKVTDENREVVIALINNMDEDDEYKQDMLDDVARGTVYFLDFVVLNHLLKKLNDII